MHTHPMLLAQLTQLRIFLANCAHHLVANLLGQLRLLDRVSDVLAHHFSFLLVME